MDAPAKTGPQLKSAVAYKSPCLTPISTTALSFVLASAPQHDTNLLSTRDRKPNQKEENKSSSKVEADKPSITFNFEADKPSITFNFGKIDGKPDNAFNLSKPPIFFDNLESSQPSFFTGAKNPFKDYNSSNNGIEINPFLLKKDGSQNPFTFSSPFYPKSTDQKDFLTHGSNAADVDYLQMSMKNDLTEEEK